MGIPHFLQEILPLSGRPLDLTTLVDSNSAAMIEASQQQHPTTAAATAADGAAGPDRLRVGVDVSSWIYRACMGFSDMLGDERHLTNLGRADLLKESRGCADNDDNGGAPPGEEGEIDELSVPAQRYVAACTEQVKRRLVKLSSCVDVLVVLDGATPPVKRPTTSGRAESRQALVRQRDDATVDATGQDTDLRIRAFKRAGAGKYYSVVVANLIHECRHSAIPFLVAPYEADGQLGYLSDNGLIDLVVSEDSDLMACSCSHVLYKMNDSLQGTLLRSRDMFASPLVMDFSEAMLAVVFAACGGDYCEKLRGIGFKTAVKVVLQAFFDDGGRSRRKPTQPPLRRVLMGLFSETWDSQANTELFQSDFERKFLSALLMYRHPVVFDPIEGRTVVARVDVDADGSPRGLDPELASYPPYVTLFQHHLHSIVGDLVPRPLCMYVAEGWVSPRTGNPYPVPDATHPLPPAVRNYLEKRASAEPAASSSPTVDG